MPTLRVSRRGCQRAGRMPRRHACTCARVPAHASMQARLFVQAKRTTHRFCSCGWGFGDRHRLVAVGKDGTDVPNQGTSIVQLARHEDSKVQLPPHLPLPAHSPSHAFLPPQQQRRDNALRAADLPSHGMHVFATELTDAPACMHACARARALSRVGLARRCRSQRQSLRTSPPTPRSTAPAGIAKTSLFLSLF